MALIILKPALVKHVEDEVLTHRGERVGVLFTWIVILQVWRSMIFNV